MTHHLLKCGQCKTYTMKSTCNCGGIAVNPKPPKYSMEDRYGEYRRKAKEENTKEEKNTNKEQGQGEEDGK